MKYCGIVARIASLVVLQTPPPLRHLVGAIFSGWRHIWLPIAPSLCHCWPPGIPILPNFCIIASHPSPHSFPAFSPHSSFCPWRPENSALMAPFVWSNLMCLQESRNCSPRRSRRCVWQKKQPNVLCHLLIGGPSHWMLG